MKRRIKKYIKKTIEGYSSRSFIIRFRKKIKELIKITSPDSLSKNQKKEIQAYFSKFGFNNVNDDWHRYYTGITKKFYKEYIPEDIYYIKIQPVFARDEMSPALTDKNLLSKIFIDVKQPVTVIKNINGYYYSNNDELIESAEAIKVCTKHEKLVIKPSIDSGGGKNITLFENNSNNPEKIVNSLNSIFEEYNKDFIIQEVVCQNNQMNLLNKSSLNTIRVFSYLRNLEVKILSSVVRIGSQGEFTDNVKVGGIACGIKNDGRLKTFGYNTKGRIFKKTDFGCELKDFQIPFFNKILSTAKTLHKKMPNFKLISWDLAIDDTGNIVLIEYNVKWQEINFHQLNNGPLFGEYTHEVLKETNNL